MENGDRKIEAEKERHFVRNAVIAPTVDWLWGFAMAATALGPILGVFLKQLGASNLLIGLAPAAYLVGNTLLQLPAAHVSQNLRRKKVFFALAHLPSCGAWVAVALLTPRLAVTHPRAMVWVVIAGLAVYSAGIGFIMPIWTELLSRMFSDRRRGLVSGLINLGAGLGGLMGGPYVAHVLSHQAFPGNYAHLFWTAGVVGALSVQLYLLGYEAVPPGREVREKVRMLPVLRRIWAEDRRMRRYLFVRSVWEFGASVVPFLAVYAVARFELPAGVGGTFVLATNVGYAVFGLWTGRLGDARGYRRTMSWAMVLGSIGLYAALTTREPWLMYAVFVLVGASAATDWMSNVNLLIEMSDESLRSYYYALTSTTLVPVRLMGPLFWGWLGDAAGLPWAFGGGLVVHGLALILLLALVDDPRRPGERLLRWRWGTLHPHLC